MNDGKFLIAMKIFVNEQRGKYFSIAVCTDFSLNSKLLVKIPNKAKTVSHH